jgi:4-hydroxy-3-polyprenylbenzoate decarboxylase
MIIVPASMGTVGRTAAGISQTLIERAADVMLKERRRLIVVVRETPYSLIHLRNMTTLTEAGAIVLPASPSFYSHPTTIDEAVDTVVERIIAHTGIDLAHYEFSGVGGK